MAASEYQALAVEEAGVGVVLEIHGHDVCAALIMDVLESVGRDGDKLALVVGGS